ncbi:MAG: TolC family protein [Thermoguttaceae bacterium]|nr:TolC family protein [Thermoguttaceae bacterium]
MNWQHGWKCFLAGLAIAGAMTGCQPQQPKFLFSRGNVAGQYIAEQTRIEYPDTCVPSLDDVVRTQAPLSLDNPDPKEEWQLTLDEVRQMALDNSKVLRELQGVSFTSAGVQGNPSLLLSYPQSTLSVWDPAIIETSPTSGVAAALSAFDAVWSSTAYWQKDRLANNVNAAASSIYSTKSDTGTFQTALSKVTATGGTFYAGTGVGYDAQNGANRMWGSDWTSYVEAGFSHPLLQGAGVEFNRIAGPNSSVGNYSGVMIARIQEDIELAEFEIGVRNYLKDLEETYWNLYYAYRNLNASGVGLEAALQSWRTVKAQYDVGYNQGTAQNIAQAEQNYQRFYVAVLEAQSNLYKNERLLRYMIGIAPTDGRLIKPVDEPTIARVKYNWDEIEAEALSRTPELRKQKWNVKRRELELVASRNYLLPRLDLEGKYRFHGMGKDLIDSTNDKSNAYGSLTHDGYRNWGLGLNMEVPIGFRRELAGVRNAELLLCRERAILQEQELELVHNLSDLYADIDRTYREVEAYLAVLRAARKEVRAVQAAYDGGMTTLFQVLDAQQKLADAETSYYRMVIDYNLAIMKLNYRKGSLLEYNGVTLAEGPWPNKAYFDATTRAMERDAAHYFNRGITLPTVISRGPYPQVQGTDPTIIPSDGIQPVTESTVGPAGELKTE